MATRAEQYRADEERKSGTKTKKKTRSARSKPGIPAKKRTRAKAHAGKKATYALEANEGRPSRKSTRKSANRAKPDANLTAREELQKGSPEKRFEKTKARSKR